MDDDGGVFLELEDRYVVVNLGVLFNGAGPDGLVQTIKQNTASLFEEFWVLRDLFLLKSNLSGRVILLHLLEILVGAQHLLIPLLKFRDEPEIRVLHKLHIPLEPGLLLLFQVSGASFRAAEVLIKLQNFVQSMVSLIIISADMVLQRNHVQLEVVILPLDMTKEKHGLHLSKGIRPRVQKVVDSLNSLHEIYRKRFVVVGKELPLDLPNIFGDVGSEVILVGLDLALVLGV